VLKENAEGRVLATHASAAVRCPPEGPRLHRMPSSNTANMRALMPLALLTRDSPPPTLPSAVSWRSTSAVSGNVCFSRLEAIT